MPTCFVATYGSGKPVIGLLGEFDALPMISQKGRVAKKDPVVEGAPGHGCGHNAMCVAAASAAIAVKEAMAAHGLKGTIKVFGSPAEEIVASRPYMIRAGLFEGVDAVIDNHSSSGFGTGLRRRRQRPVLDHLHLQGQDGPLGRRALGRAERPRRRRDHERGHELSARAPATCPSACTTSSSRAARPPTSSPTRPASGTTSATPTSGSRTCTRGSSTAPRPGPWPPGSSWPAMRVVSAIHQRHANKAAAELLQRNIELVGMPAWSEEEQAFAKALQKELEAEEKGHAQRRWRSSKRPRDDRLRRRLRPTSATSPSSRPRRPSAFPGSVPGSIGHHWSNVACWYGSTAWKGLNAGAKAIAASAIDLLTKPEELGKLRKEFEEYTKIHPYKPFLPADATPPNDLNKELMEQVPGGLLAKALAEK
ncbi:MAG: M20/M25/M40 family metallo-hydrolase [Candidatus Moduliflexus flocculans]|nr:M20/M25/M40 family metallo-hydrolase [Candidatus Moduliflexus flocculans]